MSAPVLAPADRAGPEPERLVRSLADPLDLREAGGKAFNLSRAIALGLPVPPGVVISNTVFQQVLGELSLGTSLDLDPDSAREIRERIRGAALPGAVRGAIREWWRTRPEGTVIAVRSSAVGEDSAQASFAGQLESRLNLASVEDVENAVVSSWASYFSERAWRYQVARQSRLQGMGVIVQEQVDAAFAGVLFTRSPDTADRMLGEYCPGLAEGLVSGSITPGCFSIGRADGEWRRKRAPEETTAGDSLLLNDATMEALRRLGLTLERAFGAPQDIEWAIDRAGRLWCVQSRPITAPAPVRRRSPRQLVWSNANVNENFPAPISPLLYSIASEGYSHYFRNLCRAFGLPARRIRALEHPLGNIIGVHGARMYYNLTSIHAILRAAPFGDLLVEWFNSFTGAGRSSPSEPDEPRSRTGVSRARQAAELARMAVKITGQYLFLKRRIERFERTADEFSRRTHPDALASRPLPGLLEDLRGFIDIRCNRWTGASLADAGSMICYGALKALLARALPEPEGASALQNTLLKALPGVVSGVPVIELWNLSRLIRSHPALAELFAQHDSVRILDQLRANDAFESFRDEFDRFLENWGFRSSSELMLTVPSFQENPAPVVEILKGYALLDGDSPRDIRNRHDAEREEGTAGLMDVLRQQPLVRWLPLPRMSSVIRIALRWTQRSIVYRERARLKQALLYSRCRRIALAIGASLAAAGRLGTADDVFFLTYREIDALGSGTAMFPGGVRALIGLRRAQHAELSAMSPPDSFTLPEGEYLSARDAVESRSPSFDGGATLAGTCACGGQAMGPAAVVESVADSHRIRAGDILVTRQTDPGWAAVFFLIKGLVIERGGMLSHGAILAREFGLPCVVGAAGATQAIAHGQIVTVDGDKGQVRLGGLPSNA